jgi:putative membrane protein
LLGGLLMGSADAIPGVSGGTIALIIGIYERFIAALSSAVRTPFLIRTPDGRGELKAAFALLVPLAIGLLAAYYAATKLLVGPEDAPGILRRTETAPACYAFFFGLVLVSVREPWRRMEMHTGQHWIAALVGFGAAAGLAHMPHSGGAPPTWLLLFGGAGAIAIMLLPGVSGSLFLVVIGQYAIVAGAVHDRDIAVLLVFAAGLGLGIVTFVPVLRYLLRRYYDGTMALLTGLMAGSLFVLWPFKDNYEIKAGPMNNVAPWSDNIAFVIIAFVVGGGVVLLLSRLERTLREP